MKTLKKRMLCISLTAVCALALCGCMETVEPKGKPIDDESIPSEYSLINEKKLPVMRNAADGMSDMTYALTGSAESNIITYDLSENKDIDLSENHLCYYSYMPETERKPETEGFFKSCDKAELYENAPGFDTLVCNMANGIGLEYDSKVPMSENGAAASVQKAAAMDRYGITEKYSGEFLLTDMSLLTDPEASDGITDDEQNNIKKKIMICGGVYTDILIVPDRVRAFGNEKTYYNDSFERKKGMSADKDTDHSIVIIGWDNNYPKENFSAGSKLPEKDGAWLCRCYDRSIAGESGSIWISYEERSFLRAAALDFDRYSYGKSIMRYDETGSLESIKNDGNEPTKAANIFSGANGKLNAVGITTFADKQKVHIRVYKSPEPDKPDSGQLAADTEVTVSYKGYHAIMIDSDVVLSENEKFSVIAEYENDGDIDSNIGKVPFEGNGTENAAVFSKAGESYIFRDGKWLDTSKADTAKLFKKNVLNNCCIKALIGD